MPPKPKNTKDQIAAAAFAIIKEQGCAALTARNLGLRLESSAGSIFTLYETMDEVKQHARLLAIREFMIYTAGRSVNKQEYMSLLEMIAIYGYKEPELFQLIFLSTNQLEEKRHNIIKDIYISYDQGIQQIRDDYHLSMEDAQFMFEQACTFAIGLGLRCALKQCSLSENDISARIQAQIISIRLFLNMQKI